MDFIYGILADYYFVFLAVGIVLLIALIGFIAKTKKKTEAPTVETPQIEQPQPVQMQNPQLVTASAETQNQTPQIIAEPSLDNLSSTATEVDIGVDVEMTPTSIFEIKDTSPVGTISNETTNQQMMNNIQPQPVNQPLPQPVQAPVNVSDEIDETPVATLVIEDTGKEVGTTIK